MTNPEIDELIQQLSSPVFIETPFHDLVRHGSDAVEALCQTLKDPEYYIRGRVVDALGQIGDVRAVEPLCRALGDPEFYVRWNAALALGKIRDVRAVEPLCQALNDQSEDVRWNAALALGEIGALRAVEPLCRALEDKNRYVREHAAEALVKIGPAAVEPLCNMLRDKNKNVRTEAAVTLDEIGAAEPLPRKVLAEARLTPQQRFKGLEALQQVRYKDRWRVLRYSLPDIQEYCHEMLGNGDAAVREGAQAVLGSGWRYLAYPRQT